MSTVLRSQRVAPIAAVAFGVLTLGLDLASVPLDSMTGTLGPGGQLADWVTTPRGCAGRLTLTWCRMTWSAPSITRSSPHTSRSGSRLASTGPLTPDWRYRLTGRTA